MRKLFTAFLLVPLVGCGGGSGGGGGPAPTPTVTGITINGPEGPYLVSGTYNFTATMTLSNGQTQPASGTGAAMRRRSARWPTVSLPALGWVKSPSGSTSRRADAPPSDCASIQATTARGSASTRTTSCTDSGQFRSGVKFCADIFKVGTRPELGLQMAQNGLSVETTVHLGGLVLDSATSTVGDDGRLRVDARLTEDGTTVEVTLMLHQPQTASIGGSITQNWRADGVTGSARVTGDLIDVIRLGSAGPPVPMWVTQAIAG